ncbi:molybdenum cofactor guanylyltransferase [Rhodospirillales bacterium TMPK1]|uniref:Molybdenum cofactor guanylyltransferase n=1 Tax=Roseiterribacter gracilis TaxID=2812848 RepID=A0A8S8XGP6_9PROT|nr:molybdenum cofactor guanylyltransferase [Rhodospirillales bacterium TMPK1]
MAGGLGTRMGGVDKGLLTLAGRPLLAHVIERVQPQVAQLAVNANGDPSRFAAFGFEVLPDTVEGFVGPLAGVLTGLRWAASHNLPLLLSVPTDTPFLPADLAAGFIEAIDEEGAEIAIAVSEGRPHPTASLWPVYLADHLETALRGGTRRIKEFMQDYRVIEVAFVTEAIDPFFNVNVPEDLARAEAALREGTGRT